MSQQFLKAGFVALGGAGSAVGRALQEKGYPWVGVDVSSSEAQDSNSLFLEGASMEGAYAPDQVRQRLNGQAASIRQQLERWVEEEGLDSLVLCGGLGGRTGMNLDILLSSLEDLPVLRLVVGALPHAMEHPYAKARAVEALSAITSQGPDGLILLDNGRCSDGRKASQDGTRYVGSNQAFASLFHEANSLTERPEGTWLRGLSRDWARQVFKTGGLLTFGQFEMAGSDEGFDVQEWVRKSRQFWRSPDPLIPLDEDPQATFVVCVIEAPKSVWGEPSKDLETDCRDAMADETGAYVNLAALEGDPSDTVRCDLIMSSGALPSRVEEIVKQATREARLLRQKNKLVFPTMHEEDVQLIRQMAAEGVKAEEERTVIESPCLEEAPGAEDELEAVAAEAMSPMGKEESEALWGDEDEIFGTEEDVEAWEGPEEEAESWEGPGEEEEASDLEEAPVLEEDLGISEELTPGPEEEAESWEGPGEEEEASDLEEAPVLEEDMDEDDLERMEADKIFADINQFLDDARENAPEETDDEFFERSGKPRGSRNRTGVRSPRWIFSTSRFQNPPMRAWAEKK